MRSLAALLLAHPARVALCAAALALAARSRRLLPLRPLAATVATLAALDLARLAALPRWADVTLFAAWWPCLALAVAGPLLGRWGALAAGAAGWWAVEVARTTGLAGPALAAEWWALWAVATAAQLAAVAAWAVRAWRRGERPSLPQQAALLLAAGALADAVGPWAAGALGAAGRWEVGRWQSAATWAGVCGVALWHGRRAPR